MNYIFMVLLKVMIIIDHFFDDDGDDDDDDDDVGGELTVGRHQGRFRIPERSAPLLTRL